MISFNNFNNTNINQQEQWLKNHFDKAFSKGIDDALPKELFNQPPQVLLKEFAL